jgi:endonuclease III
MPRWVVHAALRVVEEYDGDAGAIWRGRSAAQVRDRLDDFVGISQKKAAMTVMLLWRCRNEDISGMEDCDVAVDVHLRRVFLRSGLALRDDSRSMIEAARQLHPALPGALDPPAWVVGQQWCRPSDPRCDACALGSVCPRLISRADGVVGN